MQIHILDFVMWIVLMLIYWVAIDYLTDGEWTATEGWGALMGGTIFIILTLIYIGLFVVLDLNWIDIFKSIQSKYENMQIRW